MFCFFKLEERRNQQLKRELTQNSVFESKIGECSDDIVRFFLYKRELNSHNFERISKESLLKQCAVIEKNLDNLDKELDDFEDYVSKGGNACKFLKNYLGRNLDHKV